MHKILVHEQDSCVCMHNTLVHALEGPGPKAGTQQKNAAPGPDPAAFFVWVLALGSGSSSACTRVLCMHKECCACTMKKTYEQGEWKIMVPLGVPWGASGVPCSAQGDFLRFVENWTPNSEQMCPFYNACA